MIILKPDIVLEVAIILSGRKLLLAEDSTMETTLNDGCACGSIRYECESEPMLEYKCHCRACHVPTAGRKSQKLYF